MSSVCIYKNIISNRCRNQEVGDKQYANKSKIQLKGIGELKSKKIAFSIVIVSGLLMLDMF